MHDFVLVEKIKNFITSIGIAIIEAPLAEEQCFLPGLLIQNGNIILDKNKWLYPGDIVHEAGHIAVVPACERGELSGSEIGKRQDAPAEEMMAIAWSYAACRYLAIDPLFVFHEHGYKNGGKEIVDNFNQGNYFGVPVLEWLGMTSTKAERGLPLYPQMIKWLRD